MAAKRNRLDRFISQHSHYHRREVRLLLARGQITVDGQKASDINQLVDHFSRVSIDGVVLQHNRCRYLMLHKPIGVVSATKDIEHQTVFDLLPPAIQQIDGLHIAGRLDLNTSGLILLTNDGRWSKQLSHPSGGILKHYRVGVGKALDGHYIDAFAKGIHFPFEDITTAPANLRICDRHTAELTLSEGKYHQIKRMFGRFRNPVLSLHRHRIGDIKLDRQLSPGQYRNLTAQEVALIKPN